MHLFRVPWPYHRLGVVGKRYRCVLTPGEEQELEQTFKVTPDRRLRDRCQAVLRAVRGRARRLLAQDLGVHRTILRLWLQRYRERGLSGLSIQWACGQPPRIPATLAPTIVVWVRGGPTSCGRQRANWTDAELGAYLSQQPGIRVRETALREFCHHHQIRPSRPTYRYLRGDPQRQAQARAEWGALKKKPRRGHASC
jgi:transposase